jgi:hypothetical protein
MLPDAPDWTSLTRRTSLNLHVITWHRDLLRDALGLSGPGEVGKKIRYLLFANPCQHQSRARKHSFFHRRSVHTLQTVAREGLILLNKPPSVPIRAPAIAVLGLTGGICCFTVCFSVTPAGLVSEQQTSDDISYTWLYRESDEEEPSQCKCSLGLCHRGSR